MMRRVVGVVVVVKNDADISRVLIEVVSVLAEVEVLVVVILLVVVKNDADSFLSSSSSWLFDFLG